MKDIAAVTAACKRRDRSQAALAPCEPFSQTLCGNGSARWNLAKIGFRTATSAVLVAFLIRRANIWQLAGALASLRWHYFALALTTYLASQVLSAHRWAGLATAIGFARPRSRYLSLYFQGMFLGLCLPSSIGGDVVKAWRLGDNARQRVLAACTIFADRATGLYALGLIAVAALFCHWGYMPSGATPVCIMAWVATSLVAVRFGLSVLRPLAPTLERFPKLSRLVVPLRSYHDDPSVIRRAVGYSLVIQGFNVLTVLWIGCALGLAIPPATYFVAVPAAALASALPISVGGVGVRESVLAFFLVQAHVAPEVAVTVGLAWLAVLFASGLVGGAVYLLDRASDGSPAGGVPSLQSMAKEV